MRRSLIASIVLAVFVSGIFIHSGIVFMHTVKEDAHHLEIRLDVCKKTEQSQIKNIDAFVMPAGFILKPFPVLERWVTPSTEIYHQIYIPPRFRPPASV